MGKSINFIAKSLDRGVSTISEEINRNGGIQAYDSHMAQNRALERQNNKKSDSYKLLKNTRLKKIILGRLDRGMSPELISKELKKKYSYSFYASPKAIRKYIAYKLNINKP